MTARGVVAAGHPLTAQAGAAVLRAGGNAVDAAVGAMLASFVAEPLLTGLGAGGYLLVAPPDGDPVVLDFFVEAPGRDADPSARPALVPLPVSFGDAEQLFHVGAASCGTYGAPAGIVAAMERFGTVPLADLTAPAAALARAGVVVNRPQAYVFGLLAALVGGTPEARARYFVDGRPPREGDLLRDPDLADALDRLGADGAAPFYTGDLACAVADWVGARGGGLGRTDLAAYDVVERMPVHTTYRGRDVHTNPPPNAGGILLAVSLEHLSGGRSPDAAALVAAMAAAHAVRTPEFLTGLAEPGFADTLLGSRLGSTTHISVLDADGWAASVSCTNGEGSGVVVPGTGIHVNNMLGEEDLSPLGFFTHPPGRRLPSMMAPTVLRRDGETELVLGSAGSNRIRSALLQVAVNVVDHGLSVQDAVDAPRLHLDGATVFAEPGADVATVEAAGWPVSLFRERNLYFGGCQAVARVPGSGAAGRSGARGGELAGGADPRRGGAVAQA